MEKIILDVLVACEFTGIVTKEFRELGHRVTSCDLKETELPGEIGGHYRGSVLDILDMKWDLMIGFPPCTFLSYAANKYWDEEGRIKKRLEALEFFRRLWKADIKYICLENPLGLASKVITKHHQIIEPYYFGDSKKKRTCLWLKNLPKLIHVKQDDLFSKKTHVKKPKPIAYTKKGKALYETEYNTSKKDERSRFHIGVAKVMAKQWTKHIIENERI